MKAEDFLLVYCPVPSFELGEEIAYHLLSKKLVACVNLIPQAFSFYEWESKIQKTKESILLLKTKKILYVKMSQEIKKKHPYECPSIFAIALNQADVSFLKWINQSLSS